MGRLLGLLVLALLGFYVAWPAYSGYRIKNAFDTGNPQLLAAKVDFDAVRITLQPAVSLEVDKAMTAAVQQGGAENAALLGQLKVQLMPKVVDLALTNVVTPENLLRIYREGGDVRKTIKDIVAEKMGGAGGLGALAGAVGGTSGGGDLLGTLGKASGLDLGKLGGLLGRKPEAGPPSAPAVPPVPAASGAKPAVTLANIKSFAVNGPLGFSVGVARDAAASAPDVVADMAFTGGDWRLVGVTPRI